MFNWLVSDVSYPNWTGWGQCDFTAEHFKWRKSQWFFPLISTKKCEVHSLAFFLAFWIKTSFQLKLENLSNVVNSHFCCAHKKQSPKEKYATDFCEQLVCVEDQRLQWSIGLFRVNLMHYFTFSQWTIENVDMEWWGTSVSIWERVASQEHFHRTGVNCLFCGAKWRVLCLSDKISEKSGNKNLWLMGFFGFFFVRKFKVAPIFPRPSFFGEFFVVFLFLFFGFFFSLFSTWILEVPFSHRNKYSGVAHSFFNQGFLFVYFLNLKFALWWPFPFPWFALFFALVRHNFSRFLNVIASDRSSLMTSQRVIPEMETWRWNREMIRRCWLRYRSRLLTWMFLGCLVLAVVYIFMHLSDDDTTWTGRGEDSAVLKYRR